MTDFVAPAYGRGALSDLLGSAAARLGVPGYTDVIGLPQANRYVVALLDGFGQRQLDSLSQHNPLAVLARDGAAARLTCGVPSTTAVSLTSLGTGRAPGSHGVVGYTQRIPGSTRRLNSLNWDRGIDPRVWQPHPTVFDAVTAVGGAAFNVGKVEFAGSGLTVAAFRGAADRGADLDDDRLDAVRFAARAGSANLTYVYEAALDTVGHVSGWRSPEWAAAAEAVGRFVERLRAAMPADAVLLVTADHGMVDVPADRRIDISTDPQLTEGVALVAGEARFRHVYTEPGRTDQVVERWQARLGEQAEVRTGADAIDAGWFGACEDRVRPRIGDVVAAAHGDLAMLSTADFPHEPNLVGMHGSLTADEMIVPLLIG